MMIGRISSFHVDSFKPNIRANQKTNKSNGLAVNAIIANLGGNANNTNKVSKSVSLLKSLNEQKKLITESKNELVEDTLKDNKSLESIKPQLKALDKQLEALEEQINKATLEEDKTKSSPSVDKFKGESTSNKRDFLDKEKNNFGTDINTMRAVLSSTSNYSKLRVVSNVKSKMEGRARVISKEMELDAGRSSATLKSSYKSKELKGINEKLNNLTEVIDYGKQTVSDKAKVDSTNTAKTEKFDDIQYEMNVYNQNMNVPNERFEKAVINMMI